MHHLHLSQFSNSKPNKTSSTGFAGVLSNKKQQRESIAKKEKG